MKGLAASHEAHDDDARAKSTSARGSHAMVFAFPVPLPSTAFHSLNFSRRTALKNRRAPRFRQCAVHLALYFGSV